MTTVRSTAQILPTNDLGNAVVPLLEEQNGQTPWFPIRRLPAMQYSAGDEVLLLAYEQIDNECHGLVGDPWYHRALKAVGLVWVDGKPRLKSTYGDVDLDPRRTLHVMVEIGVWRVGPGGEKLVVKNRGWNLCNLVHHGPFETFDTDLIPVTGDWRYETRLRFGWTPLYLKGMVNPHMEVLPRGMLSARRLP
jgi:hypothetical protein